MTRPTGIVADGHDRYIEALEAEAKAKLKDLQDALSAEPDPARRVDLRDKIDAVKKELAAKKKAAAGSLF